ncbi:hypothetical protein [Polaribacter sp.]|uniref:hypothetical protein n=1 Tax=Polaribacter sp. TaxID=1920175 RepID=UPI003F6B70E0
MKTIYFFALISLVIVTSLNAQNSSKSQTKPFVSIYTFSSFSKNSNSFSYLNKKLNLSDFQFVYANLNDFDSNLFSIEFRNLRNYPSAFIYDDYIAYRDENLLKGFRLKNDPTLWNLHCPSPLSVQPTK